MAPARILSVKQILDSYYQLLCAISTAQSVLYPPGTIPVLRENYFVFVGCEIRSLAVVKQVQGTFRALDSKQSSLRS